MKKILLIILSCLLCINAHSQGKKFITGYDGGMMVHAGFIGADIKPLAYKASAPTFGIGGAIKLRTPFNMRLGIEGYVSTSGQDNSIAKDGSYLKSFWTGVLADYYWTFGKFMPYAGVTVGGGAQTNYIMIEGNKSDWLPEPLSYLNKKGFFAFDPFIGCDYIVTDAFHITLKIDHLFGLGKEVFVPNGPRIYFGFMFCH